VITREQAAARAREIWGTSPLVELIIVRERRRIRTNPRKHFDVMLSIRVFGMKHRDEHALDADGHARCHEECERLNVSPSPSPARILPTWTDEEIAASLRLIAPDVTNTSILLAAAERLDSGKGK
jgi:hypothetical protein